MIITIHELVLYSYTYKPQMPMHLCVQKSYVNLFMIRLKQVNIPSFLRKLVHHSDIEHHILELCINYNERDKLLFFYYHFNEYRSYTHGHPTLCGPSTYISS